MERYVRLLGILASLWGGLATLVGVSMLLLAAGAVAIVADPRGDTASIAASLTAVMFVAVGVFSLLWGVVHLWVARLLHRRNALGRALMLGLAVVNLLVFPFGTTLGAFALWTLLANEGRRLFESPRPEAIK